MTLRLPLIRRVTKTVAVGSVMLWWQSSLSACTCDPFFCHDQVGSWHMCSPQGTCDFSGRGCVCDAEGACGWESDPSCT